MTTSHGAGARWIRAALQVNPYAYNGRAAPANAFQSEDEYNNALLDRCAAQGIELIAITDHWCVNTARSLIDAAAARDIVALPGFEANSAEGVHLLVIFEAGTDLADVNAAIGVCGGTPGCANGTAGEPFADILRKMDERGALVIPAHVNVANGGMLTGRSGPPLVNMVTHPDLHAIAVTPESSAAPDQEAVCAGRKPYDRVHPLSVIFADDVTHPNALESRGAATWFKVSSTRLENLKLAVRTPSTRIAVEDPRSTSRPLIRQISWVGGFLDGVTVPLSPDLTALIGGRGTGKSTVIESLRYVLGVDALGQEAKRDHAAIVSGVLRSGTTVRLEVETISPVPHRYTIERSVPNLPVVRDASGSSTNLLPADVIGTVEIFGQHELAELAHDKASVARMLERFAGATGPDAEHDRIVGRLAENREKLQRAEKGRDDLEEELADIPRLEEHVAHYTATDLPTRLSELQRLERDSGVFTEANERVANVRSILQPLGDQQVVASLTAPIEAVDESPQKPVLEKVTAATRSLSERLAGLQASADAAVQEAVQAIEAAEAEWKASTEPQRAGHAEVLRKLVEDGHDPDKYLATTKALDTLKAKAQRREGIVKTLSELSGQRGELLGELATNEGKRLEELHEAIRSANSATKGVVIVRPVAAPDRRHIKAVVERGVKGARTQIMAAIDSEGFSPRAFVAAARVSVEELEEKFNVKGAQAASLLAAGEPLFRELEELSVGQAVDVQLDIAAGSGAREYRSLEDLSRGSVQPRCSFCCSERRALRS